MSWNENVEIIFQMINITGKYFSVVNMSLSCEEFDFSGEGWEVNILHCQV